MSTSPQKPRKSVYVVSDVDGCKYKLVMQGELRLLGTRKIKRYLEKAAHIPPAKQFLSIDGRSITDDMNGDDIGLYDGVVLRLHPAKIRDASVKQQQQAQERQPSPHTSSSLRNRSHSNRNTNSYYSNDANLPPASYVPDAGPYADVGRASRGPGGPGRFSGSLQRDAGRDGQSMDMTPATTVARQSNKTIGSNHEGSSYYMRDSDPVKVREGLTAAQAESAASRGASLGAAQVALPSRTSRRSGEGLSPSAAKNAPSQLQHHVSRSPRPSQSQGALTNSSSLVNALQEENAALRERLRGAETQLWEADQSYTQAQKELAQERLRSGTEIEGAVSEALERHKQNAAVWRTKEAELVRELDLLRRERKQAIEDRGRVIADQAELAKELESEVRMWKRAAEEKEASAQELRFHLAELQSRQDPTEDSQPRADGVGASRHRSRSASPRTAAVVGIHSTRSLESLTRDALDYLAMVLDVPAMELDANNTCVVQISDQMNVLVTLDDATERLFLYATLLSCLPRSSQERLALYEMVLEGALLGKDMAGGGVGICRENNLMLMSISVDVRHSDASALGVAARPFVDAVKVWISAVESML